MIFKYLIVGVIATTLVACASATVVEPQATRIVKNKVYDNEFENTWARAVDWFANHNVKIEKIEKPSGLLTARYKLRVSDAHLDCGEIKTTAILDQSMSRAGTLNVTVRKLGLQKSQVNVNFFGEYVLSGKDFWDGRPVSKNGRCVSTGQLEREILNFIGRR
ncbi:MAG: hypothetical protein HN731_19245 [Rhodospirillaceae bacterium]|nr:hypothetical protein [Rhodospirillaceae bacterium]MBT5940753.1 hypothetical protein [Rhodospirillaceae bacterium]MBT7957342.1 hypothetical protein [Rhodospirillaceae bacterium]